MVIRHLKGLRVNRNWFMSNNSDDKIAWLAPADNKVAVIAIVIVFAITIVLLPELALLLFCALVVSLGAIVYLQRETGSIRNNKEEAARVSLGQSFEKSKPFAISEALQFPLYIFDDQGNILYANQASENEFGKLGSGEKIFIRFRQPELRQLIEQTIATKKSHIVEYNELVPDDRWFTVELAPVPGDIGLTERPLFIIGFHDLTEARKTEQMRSDFIANASHELRTPLASLSGYLETIKGPARDDAEAIDRFTDVMLEQARRMTRLVNDLLSLSRIEMQSHVRPSDKVDISEITGSVVDSLGSVASQLNVKIEFKTPGAIHILGDRDELLQVFENLIENGCKYGEDGKKVVVSIEPDEEQKQVTVSVRDFGQGIAPEHQHRITERFYRVDVARSREKQGTGLGLAIVKHILHRHATKLGVESKPDEGARFFVKFPLLEK